MRYSVNDYCDIVDNNDYVVVVNHEFGYYFKLRKKIWNNILYYMENGLEIDFKLSAIFENLLNSGVIVDMRKCTTYEIIMLQLTNSCNLRCKHCCITEIKKVGEVDYAIVDRVIKLNPQAIGLSGGEPMMHPEFWDIVAYVKERYSGKLILSTNGMFITEDNIEALCTNFDKISISLDGLSENEVDRIRGKGVYKKAISAIKLLRNHGKKVEISTILLHEYREKVAYLENEYGVSVLKRELNIAGRALTNLDRLIVGGKDSYINFKLKEFRNDIDLDLHKCGLIKYELYVALDGAIYPCPGLAADKFVLGNIKNAEDKSSLKKLGNYKKIRDKMLLQEKFKRCRECSYIGLCWACLSIMDGFANIPEVFEGWCNSRKRIIHAILSE